MTRLLSFPTTFSMPIWMLGLVLFVSSPALAQQELDVAKDFKQNCMSCHTIGGGPLTGPDLKGVSERAEREWLVSFIQDPRAVIDSGDARATEMVDKFNGAIMPTIPGMTKKRASALLDLIEAESKKERSEFAGMQISERPFTAEDVAKGRALFMGRQELENGGPACVSCHTVGGMGWLGGGKLGPELTDVYERMGGRKALGTWLSAPATPTMQPVYKPKPLTGDEVLPLLAYFEHTSKNQTADRTATSLIFILLGLGGATGLLFLFDGIWRNRFRGVRRPLVERYMNGDEQ